MISQDIIKRYLKGEATAADLKQLKRYLGSDDLSVLHKQMAEDWENAEELEKAVPKKLSAEMLTEIKRQTAKPKVQKLKANRRSWLAVAAAVTLLVLGFALWPETTEQMYAYSTGQDQWKMIELPDGSSVKLNANSELSFTKEWKPGNHRKVWLKGEAFFEVERKPATNAKFTVITDDLEVEVLGTAFNVNTRGDQTDVFLEEGSIKLNLAGREETLSPGDFITYSGKEKTIIERKDKTTAATHASWKDGVLELKDRTVQEIIDKIEEIYSVEVEIQDSSILQEVKTLSVPKDKLEVAIPVLERIFGSEISQDGKRLIIE